MFGKRENERIEKLVMKWNWKVMKNTKKVNEIRSKRIENIETKWRGNWRNRKKNAILSRWKPRRNISLMKLKLKKREIDELKILWKERTDELKIYWKEKIYELKILKKR